MVYLFPLVEFSKLLGMRCSAQYLTSTNDCILLCGMRDVEHHTYCLNPLLARIPEGNWYCYSCIAGTSRLSVFRHTHIIA